ncbi:MAG: nicotinate-nucleotide--dimethylbenzimidazole phosphoribosyltransferase [Clostridia bacterium]
MNLETAIEIILPLDQNAMHLTKLRLDSLTKPLNSLGKLEQNVIQLAGIQQTSQPDIRKRAVVVMCADNGVVAEGISSCPKEVTATVTRNFLKGFTGVNIFANITKSDLVICDIGVDEDLSDVPGILNRKIRCGTDNIMIGPAMTRDEAIRAIEVGIDLVDMLYKDGYQLIGTGEMGIGNTTTSAAISTVLTECDPGLMTGRGAGLSNQALSHKTNVVKKAIDQNAPYSDPIDVLSKLGGFDIAGLAGCFIGAAVHRLPCVVDGYISAVAALVAVRICPQVRDYIFVSHQSKEPGMIKVLAALEMEASLHLEMCLGEGTGAALSFLLLDAALEAYYKMGTFDDAKIEQYTPQV